MRFILKNNQLHQIVRPKDTAKECGFALSTLWGRLNPKSTQFDPEFPRPFRLSSNRARGAVGWLRADIMAYLDKCAQRSADGR